MSADLALYTFAYGDDETVDVWDQLQSIEYISSDPERKGEISFEEHGRLWRRIYERSNSIEVGQVSSLKAGLSGDYDRYVPAAVARTWELIGDGKVLTPGLAKEITVAFNLPNRSIYGHVTYDHLRGESIANAREYARRFAGDPWSSTFREPNILVHRKGRGVAKGRTVKRFLEANLGRYIVCELV